MNKVWILTSEHNDYDQYGEYFLAVFSVKPNRKMLTKALKGECVFDDDMLGLRLTKHLLKGGGRQEYEEEWYFLREVDIIE